MRWPATGKLDKSSFGFSGAACPTGILWPSSPSASPRCSWVGRSREAGQKGYDLVTPAGEFVQVRYLANPAGEWVNGHLVDFRGGCDRYALLVVEDLDAKSLLAFTRETMPDVCGALKKRHPNQDTTLQLTQANYRTLLADPQRFAPLGVNVFRLTA